MPAAGYRKFTKAERKLIKRKVLKFISNYTGTDRISAATIADFLNNDSLYANGDPWSARNFRSFNATAKIKYKSPRKYAPRASRHAETVTPSVGGVSSDTLALAEIILASGLDSTAKITVLGALLGGVK